MASVLGPDGTPVNPAPGVTPGASATPRRPAEQNLEDLVSQAKSAGGRIGRREFTLTEDVLKDRVQGLKEQLGDYWQFEAGAKSKVNTKGTFQYQGEVLIDPEVVLRQRENITQKIAEYKSEGWDVKYLEQELKEFDRELRRDARQVFRAMDRSATTAEKLVGAIDKQRSKDMKEFRRELDDHARDLREELSGLEKEHPRYAALKEELKTFEKNRETVVSQAEKFYEKEIESYRSVAEKARTQLKEFEEVTQLKAADFIGKESSLLKSAENIGKEASAAEHATNGAKPSHFGMTAGGAVAGAAVGYLASDDENKAKNTVIGGAVGGIIGQIASRFFKKGATNQLGAFSREPGLLKQVTAAASHMHR